MDKIINVGIAGFGMSGQIFQAPFLDYDKHFVIKKVYERSTSISKEQYPYIEVVRSFEELFGEEIDIVVISTPNAQHFQMAKQALGAGKHVIVEKPVSATVEEAEELMALAKEKGVLFSVYQNRRFDGNFLTVKKIVEDGRLGKIVDYTVHFDTFATGISKKAWKAAGGKGVGKLYDLGVHLIDQVYSLFGMPLEVYADIRSEREESKADDNFQVLLYYADKKIDVCASELVLEKGPQVAVHGTKGSFVKYGMDPQERALICGEKPGSEGFGVDEEENWGVLHTKVDEVEKREKIPTETGFYGYFYDNIYQVLIEGAELIVKPEQSRDVLRIIEAAIQSKEEKRRITL